MVRICGPYAVIDGEDTKYYRHPIHTFDFTALDGKDKWVGGISVRQERLQHMDAYTLRNNLLSYRSGAVRARILTSRCSQQRGYHRT